MRRDGELTAFRQAKCKELLAYLIDRQGGSVTRAEAFAILWEDWMYDRGMQKQFDVIIRSLRDTLEEYGVGEILEMKKGALRIRPELISCDAWRFFKGDTDAVNAFRGEYMSAYALGSHTAGLVAPSERFPKAEKRAGVLFRLHDSRDCPVNVQ